jgi:hypothetical protein
MPLAWLRLLQVLFRLLARLHRASRSWALAADVAVVAAIVVVAGIGCSCSEHSLGCCTGYSFVVVHIRIAGIAARILAAVRTEGNHHIAADRSRTVETAVPE